MGGAASSIPSPVSPRYWHWGAPIAPWVFPIMWDPGTDASGSSSLHCRLPSQVPQSPGGPPPLVSLIHTSGWYLRAAVVRVLPQDWSPILCALVTPGLDLPSRSVWMCPSCPGLPSDQAQGLSWGGGVGRALALCSLHTPCHSFTQLRRGCGDAYPGHFPVPVCRVLLLPVHTPASYTEVWHISPFPTPLLSTPRWRCNEDCSLLNGIRALTPWLSSTLFTSPAQEPRDTALHTLAFSHLQPVQWNQCARFAGLLLLTPFT